MSKYIQKPIVIEAFQMTKERRLDNSEWPNWLNAAWQKPVAEAGALFCCSDGCLEGETYAQMFIHTIGGVRKVSWDGWIILGTEGEIYTCPPSIFDKTYGEADHI